jgi:hypothetical protein
MRAAALVAAFALVAVAVLAPSPAAAADKPAKPKKNQAWVAPDWDARAIRTIAFTPVRSNDHNPESEALVRRFLEAELADRSIRIAGQGAVLEAVKRGGADASLRAAHGAFGRGAPLDTTSARILQGALGNDAILLTNVTNWQRYVVDENTRGQSFTQVAVDVALYALADGAIVWRGSFQEKGDGPYNEPRSADAPTRDPGSNAFGSKGALEPPAFEEVVEKLATRIAATLPKPAAKPAAGGGS